jgi:hypothetical protein
MWTKHDIIRTGNNILDVKESKLKAQNILRYSESIQLNNLTLTGILFIPTSKNTTILNIVVIAIQLQVISCAPVTPTFLPKNPEIIEPIKGKNINVKYII